MRLLAVAVGLQASPIFALHALSHSLAKCAAFLLSGCVVREFGTVNLSKLSGLVRRSPSLGFALLAAGAAIMGAPPFAAFASEWLLLSRAVDQGYTFIVIALVAGLAIGFVAVLIHLGRVVFGEKPGKPEEGISGPALLPSIAMLTLAAAAMIAFSSGTLETLNRMFMMGGMR